LNDNDSALYKLTFIIIILLLYVDSPTNWRVWTSRGVIYFSGVAGVGVGTDPPSLGHGGSWDLQTFGEFGEVSGRWWVRMLATNWECTVYVKKFPLIFF